MNYFITTIPIIRKKYDTTRSAKFKADLSFVSNDAGIIYAWQINIKSCHIDIFSTPSWFMNRNPQFIRRERLFSLLELEQEPRPSKTDNSIIELNPKQLKVLNNYLSDEYDSTLKNIVGLLKGNNPGGEAKDPTSAEMIIEDVSNPNFVILIDDLTTIKSANFYSYAISAKEKSFDEYVNTRKEISYAYKLMQEPKTIDDYRVYLNAIKLFVSENRRDLMLIKKTLKNYRSEYSNNINKVVERFPFGFQDSNDFQKAHIEESHSIEKDIIELSKKIDHEAACKRYKKVLTDPQNFIPLSENVHRRFDAYDITFNSSGEMVALTELGREMMLRDSFKRFKKIDPWFMTQKRIEYINARNKRIGYNE